MDSRFYQGKISSLPEENEKLNVPERLSHIEHDIIMNYTLLTESIEKSEKYEKYLDKLMQREENSAEFRKAAKLKIVTSGILSGLGLICMAVWYAAKDIIKH